MPKLGMEKIRRQQVIDSVLKCIAQEGIEKVTLEKTARKAGISKGVVAYYFSSKENLLYQSFKAFLESYLEFPEEESHVFESASARELLMLVGKSVLGLLPREGILSQEDCKTIIMQIYSRLSLSSEYKEMVRGVYEQYLEGFEKILSYGIENNEFSVDDVHNRAVQLMAMLDGFTIYSILEFRGTEQDQFRRYVDYVNEL